MQRDPASEAAPVPPDLRPALDVTVRFAIVTTLLLVMLWLIGRVLLLVFAGLLLALLLRGASRLLAAWTPLPPGAALAIVLAGLVVLFGLGLWWAAPSVADQLDQLGSQLRQAVGALRQQLEQYAWGRDMIERLNEAGTSTGARVASTVFGAFSATFGALANVAIVLFIAIYLAAEPAMYRRGIVTLVTPSYRARAQAVLDAVGETLQWWLVGQLVAMTAIGLLTWVGLMLLGVPLAAILALVAALLAFIPYIGPILGYIPAVLVAFSVGPTTALYAVLLYLAVQTLESYVLTPLVQERAVSVPPALNIGVQVAVGVLFGGLGLALATPITAAGLVLTRMLYIEDVLGDRGAAA